jgi:WD40 repeat protein
LQLLDECRPGANPPDGAERGRQGQQASEPAPRDLRHWEWHHLRRRCRQRLLILPVSAGFLYFSGSGRQLFLDLGLISLRKPVPTTDWWSPGWVRGWDAHSGEEVTDWRDAGLSLNGDGRRLAVTRSRTAKVFDLDAGKKLFTISRLPSAWPVRFRSHGQWLFQLHSQAVGPHRADIWEAATGKHRLSLYVGDTFFSPDGRRLVTANIMRDRLGMGYVAGELRCLNLSTGKELYTCPGVWAAFSPDGKRFVTGGRPIAKHDGKVRVRDAASGRELVALELGGGNRQPIGAARFSPDGKRLVTFSSRDWWPSETILWDAVKGKKLLTLPLL